MCQRLWPIPLKVIRADFSENCLDEELTGILSTFILFDSDLLEYNIFRESLGVYHHEGWVGRMNRMTSNYIEKWVVNVDELMKFRWNIVVILIYSRVDKLSSICPLCKTDIQTIKSVSKPITGSDTDGSMWVFSLWVPLWLYTQSTQ